MFTTIETKEEFDAVEKEVFKLLDKPSLSKEEEENLDRLGDLLLEYEEKYPPFV